MNVAFATLAGIAFLLLCSRLYGHFIERRIGIDPARSTPAQSLNDARDYVPTRRSVLFAHHFATIAGAGPIVGPTLAILYGFMPAALWVLLGGVFMGAVHDFTALFASMREDGRSMAEISRRTMGKAGFSLFIGFTTTMIVLVTASFLNLTAKALTSLWPVEKLGLNASQTLLKTVVKDGVLMGQIGGIASSSVIVLTVVAPLMGYLLYKRHIHTGLAYMVAASVCIASIYVGLWRPVSISPSAWSIVLSVYVFFAAGVPVWVILQPRDFINSQILYGGIVLMGFCLIAAGSGGSQVTFPSFNLAEAIGKLGLLWPMMFVTIACGAISGFHCLVASGTTAKQCASEGHAKTIAYDGMLVECALAFLVLLTVGSAFSISDYQAVVWTESNPVLGFSLAVGRLAHKAIGIVPVALGTVFGILMLEGFLITTLDASVRLNRYLFEELWGILFKDPPRFMKHYWFNAGLSVVVMWVVARTNAVELIWPVFGTANQLLAALTLLVVSAWLLNRGVRPWFTFVPAVFMMATTFCSLGLLFFKYLEKQSYLLLVTDILLFALALGVIFVAVKAHARRYNHVAVERDARPTR